MAYIGPEVNERQRALDQGMNNLIQGLQGYQEQKRAEALANEEAARKAKQDKLNLLTQSRQLGVSPEELQNAMTYESGLENLGRTLEENRQKELQTKGEEQKYKRDLEKQKLDIERAKLSGSLSEQAANRALKQQELAIKRAEKADKASGKGAEGDLKSTQYTAATYAQRIEDANKEMEALQKSGFDRTGLGTSLLSSFAPEALKPQELKRQDQAERNFVNAVLRKESGAAISPTEFENAQKQYFPRVGDTADVIAQKARNRQVAMAGLQAEAGGALAQLKGRLGQPVAQPVSSGGLMPSAVAAPTIDTTKLTREQKLQMLRGR